jgi:hypothetical protein
VPTRIDYGDVGDRLRRFLHLTGRINTRVDETVTAVTVLQDLSIDPFRTDPRTWSGTLARVLSAANNSVAGITAAARTAVFPGELLVVDTAIVDAPAAAAGASVLSLLLARQGAVSGLAGFIVSPQFCSILNAPSPVGTTQRLASTLFSATPVGIPAFAQGVDSRDTPGPGGAIEYFGPPIVLFPGDSLFYLDNTVNETIRMTMTGRAYDPTFLTR